MFAVRLNGKRKHPVHIDVQSAARPHANGENDEEVHGDKQRLQLVQPHDSTGDETAAYNRAGRNRFFFFLIIIVLNRTRKTPGDEDDDPNDNLIDCTHLQ